MNERAEPAWTATQVSTGVSALGPGAVVDGHVRVSQLVLQHVGDLARPIPDRAVGDHPAIGHDALRLVELLQLLGVGRSPVILAENVDRNVDSSGYVAGAPDILRGPGRPE